MTDKEAIEILQDGIPAEITEEQAIDKLHETGWMQRHDKEMTEQPTGEWIEGENGNIKCNQCGCEIRYSYFIGNKPDFPKFCCDCGAKMKMKGGETNVKTD